MLGNFASCYMSSCSAVTLTLYNDIVVTRTTIGLMLAGLFVSLLLVGGGIVCAARGFICLVFG